MRKRDSIFRLLRDCLGLTAGEMAAECGISRAYWSQLESGARRAPSDDVVMDIARRCGIDPSVIHKFIDDTDLARVRTAMLASLDAMADGLRRR